MHSEAKKLHLIEEILKIENDTVLDEVEALLNSSHMPNEIHKSEFETLISDQELTKMCMSISEQSLREDWDTEEDAHWQSFLK